MQVPAKQLTGVLKTDTTVTSNVIQDLGGFRIINLGTPTLGTDAANKNYVDNLVNGIRWKQPAVAVSVGVNVPTTGPATVDGVILATNDRVLLTAQTLPVENGLWVVDTAGAWTRPTDFANGSDQENAAVFIEEGTTYADTAWVQTAGPAVVGTDPLAFAQFASPGVITASTGLVKVGNDIQLIQTAITPATSDASAAVVGVSQEAAHADHKHQVAVGSPVAVGSANNAGASNNLVRADHVHRAENQQIQVATVNQTQRFNLNFVGSGVSITPTDDGVNDRTTLTFTVPAGASPDKVIANPVVTTGNNDPTGISLATATTGATQVTVNGAEQRVQPTAGAPGAFDCFWSNDGGVTALANDNVPSGATLRWQGTNAGFQLAATDTVILGYNA